MKKTALVASGTVLLLLALLVQPGSAQVLGSCGTPTENEPAKVEGAPGAARPADALVVQPMPLPGMHAINFELPAVVGDSIQMVKLSDYAGKWRVLCFYPADFTFV